MSTDITERKRLEESLKQADRRKDAFIATIAHELRQPLAPIVTALELVKRRISEEATMHAHEVIERQVRQMERLIEDLLDASRISQGKVAIRPERIALNDVMSHAVSVVRPLVREREQDLQVHVPDEVIWLEANPDRLQQVFSNLLNNAAKFTPPRGRISVTAEPELEVITVRVTDTGSGITPDLLPRVFDLFTQASADERELAWACRRTRSRGPARRNRHRPQRRARQGQRVRRPPAARPGWLMGRPRRDWTSARRPGLHTPGYRSDPGLPIHEATAGLEIGQSTAAAPASAPISDQVCPIAAGKR